MPSDLRIAWTLSGRGWALCTVADHGSTAHLTASYIGHAPEDLLNAVSGLFTGQAETRAQFEAEPTVFRWIFHRQDATVRIRVLEHRHGGLHDDAYIEIWSSRQELDRLARSVVRCFDEVAAAHGAPATSARGVRNSRREARSPQKPLAGPPLHLRT